MVAWHQCHYRVGPLNVLAWGLRHGCHGVETKMALGYLGVDVVIPPFPHKYDRRGYGSSVPILKTKKFSCCIPQTIIKFHNVTMPSWMTIVDVIFHTYINIE